MSRIVWSHTLNKIIFYGLFVVCFKQIQNTVGNPEVFSEFKRMNGWIKYVLCISLDGIVSGACYCTPSITRVFSLQECVLAAFVVSSEDMLWQYCSLRIPGTFVGCSVRYGGNRRQDHRWAKCGCCSCVNLKAYKKFFFKFQCQSEALTAKMKVYLAVCVLICGKHAVQCGIFRALSTLIESAS
jgi:hypothetical protein